MKRYFYNDQLFDNKIKENTEYMIVGVPNSVGIAKKKSGFISTLYVTDEKGKVEFERYFYYLDETIKTGQSWYMIINSSNTKNYFINDQIFNGEFDNSVEYDFSNVADCVGVSSKIVNNKMRYCVYETDEDGYVFFSEVVDDKEVALNKASKCYLYRTHLFSIIDDNGNEKVKTIGNDKL